MVVEIEIICPHCGEPFASTADTSQGTYSNVEDCAVCCRPMQVTVECEPGEVFSIQIERS